MNRFGSVSALSISSSVDRSRFNDWERMNSDSDAYEAAADYLEHCPEEWEPCDSCEFDHVGPGMVFRITPCDGCVETVLEAWEEQAIEARAEALAED